MTEPVQRGLLDTSVLIDLPRIPEASLPSELSVAAVTLAELAAGIHTGEDSVERSARMQTLMVAEATFEALPFDAEAARAYGHLVALVLKAGQSPRPRRMDLLIAATAVANELPLYTRNPKDFSALHTALRVYAV